MIKPEYPNQSRLPRVFEGRKATHVVVLLVAGIIARAKFLFAPDTIILGWRQADMGSIALNYFRRGFDFLHPQINWGGNGPGLVEMEFPLVPYLTALLYSVFGVHDLVAVVVPFLSGLGVVGGIYLLVSYLYGKSAGFFAGLVAALSPMVSFFAQTFVVESSLLCLSVFGILFLVRWVEEDRNWLFIGSALLISLSILLKITALYLGFVILFLFLVKYRMQFLGRWQTWLFASLVLIPPLLWYMHAHQLYKVYGNTFGILAGGYNKFSTMALLASPSFYTLVAGRILFYILTPAVGLLALYGVTRRQQHPVRYLPHAWLAGLLLFLLVVAEGNKDMNYYQLPFLVPGAALGGFGVVSLLQALGRWTQSKSVKNGEKAVAILFIAVLAASFAGSWIVFEKRTAENHYERAYEQKSIGIRVGEVTDPGSLVVVTGVYGSDKTPRTIDTPPEVFYFGDRKGWYMALTWVTESLLEDLRKKGASYVVVGGSQDVMAFTSNDRLFQYVTSAYPLIFMDTTCIIYDIRHRKAAHIAISSINAPGK